MLLIISESGILLMVSIATVLLMSALSSALNLPTFLYCPVVKIKLALLLLPLTEVSFMTLGFFHVIGFFESAGKITVRVAPLPSVLFWAKTFPP